MRGAKGLETVLFTPYRAGPVFSIQTAAVNYCFTNALTKSCEHMLQESLALQNRRLSDTGYPEPLVVSVAEGLLQKMRAVRQSQKKDVAGSDVRRKIAVIPYIHQTSHNLKKIGKHVGVDVVFSAPLKLSILCKKTNPCNIKEKKSCKIQHQDRFISCDEGVVYRVPLACGREYIGQTGRCVNTRLRAQEVCK